MNTSLLKVPKINEAIVKAVAKKMINSTSSENMLFSSFSLTVTKSGYGFTIRKGLKEIYKY